MLFCPLCSGSSGNSTFIEACGRRILIDAGLSAKRISELLEDIDVPVDSISAILVTHEHSDHINGIGVLSKKYQIPVYANAECFSSFPEAISSKIPTSCIRIFEPDHDFYISGIRVFPFSTPHDSSHSVGFCITAKGCKCTIMTDIGHIDSRMLEIASGSDVLLIEANHDIDMLNAGPYPYILKKRILSSHGHLSNEACGAALVELYRTGVRNVVLGHLSQENNTPELARITVESTLKANGIDDVNLTIAKKDMPAGIFDIQ